ncbi:hypothetical protein BGZ76_008034 [Entomortierella beljakovae]|nr:hypothetical protein BGZ76_008034 [Entomortierella beljakovae]
MFKLLRASSLSTLNQSVLRNGQVNRLSLSAFSISIKNNPVTRQLSTSASTTTTTSATLNSDNVQKLVFSTVAELMGIKEPADIERITLKSQMKSDLGMDIFKTYQLIDKVERHFNSIDIPVESADKAQTLEDIVNLVINANTKADAKNAK